MRPDRHLAQNSFVLAPVGPGGSGPVCTAPGALPPRSDRIAPWPPISLPYFLSLPDVPGPWPGIVVIHEGGGISPQLLRVCERLAGEGYAAIAPDLFFRSGGTEAADFATLIGALAPEEALADWPPPPAPCERSAPTGSA